MIEIIPAHTTSDFLQIETLADTIWREHYIPMIGKQQIDYMLHKFQSFDAIEKQVIDGFEYFLLSYGKTPVGYMATKKETDALFLSKIYILNPYRGKKIGKAAFLFIEGKAKNYHLKSIRLTVNINNSNSIKVYERLGFVKMGSLVTDIGNGFVMDDYEMIKFL